MSIVTKTGDSGTTALMFGRRVQYQGSKRALAPLILQYLLVNTTRLVEPFCGSAASARSAAVPGCGSGHRPGARSRNWRRDAASTRRRGRLRYD
jgi:hypothetical protein